MDTPYPWSIYTVLAMHLKYIFLAEIISDEQVIRELKKYESLLLEERSYWFQVRHELEEIHHDLGAVKVDVRALQEGQPDLIKSFQSNLAGNNYCGISNPF